jgi:hypothetical protein
MKSLWIATAACLAISSAAFAAEPTTTSSTRVALSDTQMSAVAAGGYYRPSENNWAYASGRQTQGCLAVCGIAVNVSILSEGGGATGMGQSQTVKATNY